MFRRFVSLFAATLFFCVCAFALRVAGEQRALASRLIRLHVVGASDGPADQARKLAVRDALLPRIAELTAGCADADDAEAALRRGLPLLRRTAALALGTGEPVTAGLAEETFPRRDYDCFSLPAGTYRALRVTLGAGEGHNWWCVAFPALCLPAAEPEAAAAAFGEAAVAAGLSEGEIDLMRADTENVRFKFRILDWISFLFTD